MCLFLCQPVSDSFNKPRQELTLSEQTRVIGEMQTTLVILKNLKAARGK